MIAENEYIGASSPDPCTHTGVETINYFCITKAS